MDNIFYTYVYLDPRKSGKFIYGVYKFDNEPFYVGKGKNKQYMSHLSYVLKGKIDKHNPHKSYKIKNIIKETNQNPIIIKYKEILVEAESFDLEVNLIKTIGRFDLNLGPLTNLTNGGEGASGWIPNEEWRDKVSKRNKGKIVSEDTRKKLSEYMMGRFIGENNPFYGKKHTKESIEKFTRNGEDHAFYGKNHSETTKKKMSESQLGEKNHMYGKNGYWKGKKRSEETKRKISESRKGKYNGKDNPFYGRKHTDESKEKMRQPRLRTKLNKEK